MDYKGRLQRLQKALCQHKLDMLLVTHLPNIRYLCGFTGSAAALLVAERGAILFTDGRYRTQAKEEVKGARIMIAQKSPLLAAAEWFAGQRRAAKPAWLGIEPESITAGMRDRLAATLKGKARLRSAPPPVSYTHLTLPTILRV